MTKFALIPLLKTINFSIEENEKYKNLKEAINYKIFLYKDTYKNFTKLFNKNGKLQKGLIITDNYSDQPIFDFDIYSNAIEKIIKNSFPNFTIGIYGDWGTGKTTFMHSIERELNKTKNFITVWFDAWKYENEKEFALIPLLKTINYSLEDNNDKNRIALKEALKEAAIFTLGVSGNIVSS
jgi:KAP family P-loop domain